MSSPVPASVGTVNEGGGPTLLLAPPSGIANGDLLEAFVYAQGISAGIPASTGWTLKFSHALGNADGGYVAILWKRAASESGSYTFTSSGAADTFGFITRITGAVASGDPYDVVGTVAEGTSTAPSAPSVSTTYPNSLLRWYCQNYLNSNPGTPPSGMTGTQGISFYVAGKALAGTGATGAQAGTITTSDDWSVFLSAIASVTSLKDQSAFDIGADDGSESTYTLGGLNTNATISASIRKIIRCQLNYTDDPPSIFPTLYAQKNGSGGYAVVPVGATTTFALPTWVSSGTPVTGTGSITVGTPVGFAAGNLLGMAVETANQAVALPPSGWTEDVNSPQSTGTAAGTTATRLSLYWKIASGSETGINIGDAGDHTTGVMFCLGGNHQTLASALHQSAGSVAASAGTSVTWPGVTTTVPNCLIMNICANATDTATAQMSAEANASLASVTERVDTNSSSGNGGGLTIVTGTLASAGASGSTTGTLATSSVQARITVAIRPPADISNAVYIDASSHITAGGEATTARLTAPGAKTTGDFQTGRIWDDENGSDSSDPTANEYSEFAWAAYFDVSLMTAADYYEFRAYAGSTPLDSYSNTAKVTYSSGSSYSVSLSEAGSAADSIAAMLAALSTLAESGSAATAQSALSVLVAALSESGSAVDAPSSAATLPSAIAESGSATDAISMALLLLAAVSDAASAADSLSSVLQAIAALSEVGSAADAPSSAGTLAASLTEAGSAVDTPSSIATLPASVTESGAATDSPSAGATTYPVSIAEAGAAIDAPSSAGSLSASFTESGAAADASSLVVALPGAISEAGSAADSQSSTAVRPASMAEAGAATDASASTAVLAGVLAEAGVVADVYNSIGALAAALAEAGTAVDAYSTSGAAYSVTVAETGNLTDLLTAAIAAASALGESGAAADTMNAVAALNGALSEAGAAIDALQLAGTVTVVITEAANAQAVVSILSNQIPGGAVIVVPYQNRTIGVAHEERVIVIAAARRTITVH